MRQTLSLIMIVGVLLATASPLTAAAQSSRAAAAPPAIVDQYIVALKPGRDASTVARAAGVTPKHIFRRALNGFVATLNAGQRTALQRHADVTLIEADQPIVGTGTQTIDSTGGLWGLDRIDQRALPLSGSYTYTTSGTGITAYIIDSGLQANHPDFGGRAQNVYDAFGESGNDCHGHGTHVAGIVGGTTYGLAKQVNLRGVRVLQCDAQGFLSDAVRGLDWVTINAVKPAVATLAIAPENLTSSNSIALQLAIESLISSDVFVTVSVGNGNTDGCALAPANVSAAFTVAAATRTDQRYAASNYGSCVDSYAPGAAITSTWINSSTNTLSGTSQATAFAAGVAVLYKAAYGDAPQAAITDWLIANATQNAITNNPAGTPNRLLYLPNLGSMVSAGTYHTCGLRGDQTLACWGVQSDGPGVPSTDSFASLEMGGEHVCGLRTTGTLACWGSNDFGQATPPTGSFTQVAAGNYHTCAVRTNQAVACWGRNIYGEGTPPTGTFIQVTAGIHHTCAIRTDQSVACWGNNIHGEASPPSGTFTEINAINSRTCGIRTNQSIACWGFSNNPPGMLPTGTFTQVAAGDSHACAIRSDQSVTCWGYNLLGQATPPSGTFTEIAAGDSHSCGIRTDQSIVCWGSNTWSRATPPSGTFTEISAGNSHTCGIRTDQSVACWGYNYYGQATPPSGTFTEISAGNSHTCGIRTNQSIACWGSSFSGLTSPPSGTFTQIAVGDYHTCALRMDRSITCWGLNDKGQTTTPSGSFTQISAGDYHTCAIRANQSIACWGNNDEGQATPSANWY